MKVCKMVAIAVSFLYVAICAVPQSTSASIHPNQVPDYTQQFPGALLRQGPPLRRVALTFDDGPDNFYTPQILRILAREHVLATFFVLGEQVERHPDVIRKIYQAGHAIGNHTYDHADLAHSTQQQLQWEVDRTERDISRATGLHTKWFRPPYGSVNANVLNSLSKMGYQAVNWTVDSRDWRSLSTVQVEHNILGSVFPGAIILQHCAGNSKEILTGTVNALPVIIHTLRAQGYAFVTIAELLAPDARPVHISHDSVHNRTSARK